MTTVTIHKAKTTLSQLISRAEQGEEIVIARGDKPAVRLVPVAEAPRKRGFGSMKGLIRLTRKQALEPMTKEELAEWE